MAADFISLFIISAVAVIAPLVAELPLRRRLPAVVIEISLGIAIGPHGLGLTTASGALGFLGVLGLAFLFFLAGLEIDFKLIQGRPLTLAFLGWGLSLALATAISVVLSLSGFVRGTELVAIALCTTSLGILVPILRDSGELQSRLGSMALAAGTAGEFGPIVLMSLVLTGDTSRGVHLALLITFTTVAIGSAVIAIRFHPPAAIRLLGRGMHATSQLPVRVSLLVLVGLAYLAQTLGLDVILGAFAAGLVVSLASRGRPGLPLREKLDGIGFGFLVPIFFITSGIHFDLTALLASTNSLLRLPVFLALFLVVRGLPVLLYRNDIARWDLAPLALFSATGLPLIVAISEIGVATGRMRTDNAAALVGAAMISVFLFPFCALLLRSRHIRSTAEWSAQRVAASPRPT
jgi:Kef-type K+ transport system membrane component KefB